jgi:hypothetical protein
VHLAEVRRATATVRGAGGFGSTGKSSAMRTPPTRASKKKGGR